MKTKQTLSQKLISGIVHAAFAIGFTAVAAIGITLVVCLVICIKDLIKLIVL